MSLNGVSTTSSVMGDKDCTSVLSYLKGEEKFLKTFKSYNSMSGWENLWGNKYLVCHLFLLIILVRVILLPILGVKGTIDCSMFMGVISSTWALLVSMISSIMGLGKARCCTSNSSS